MRVIPAFIAKEVDESELQDVKHDLEEGGPTNKARADGVYSRRVQRNADTIAAGRSQDVDQRLGQGWSSSGS
jgi:hypothetical protein